MAEELLTFRNTAKISLNWNGNNQTSYSFNNKNMNAKIGYFIGFALGCIAMFIALKLDFSSIAKMVLIFTLLIGSVRISWVGDEK